MFRHKVDVVLMSFDGRCYVNVSVRPKADMGMAAAPSQRPMTSANTLPNLAMAALLSTIGAVV